MARGKSNTGGDDRFTRASENVPGEDSAPSGHDDRVLRSDEQEREGRAMDGRDERQGRADEAEAFDMLTSSAWNEVLPDIPDIPGYHVCWLSTTNSYDPISKRIRLGYTPVRPEDLPRGHRERFKTMQVKSGEFQGMISINEMVAFKLPDEMYQKYMRHLHHDLPNSEEGAIREVIESIENDGRVSAEVGDGFRFAQRKAPAAFR